MSKEKQKFGDNNEVLQYLQHQGTKDSKGALGKRPIHRICAL